MMKLVECIPNFSVSRERDEAAFNALVETAQAVAGCTVLDVQSDGTHNRCVFTLVGSPEGIGEAAFRLAKRAMEVIDMTKHQGAHPRMGATDVIPFVPTMDMTVEECVELSRQVARRIWEELGIPSFLYEESATAPGRVNLAKIRKGQFEGMPEKLLEPEWAPDFGERKVHPTAGIIAIGARMPLVAFNVNLDTDNVEIAKSIAKAIRGSSGGFKFCKAIGLLLEDRNVAQVSMNMVNYEGTPLYYAYEMIRALADRWGVRIIGTELVGLTPFRSYYPDQLSASMLQRVVIARAFATEPELLLMDEPYGQLDTELRYRLENELLNLWKQSGTTVIFITHNIEEAVYLGERILVLSNKPTTIKREIENDLPRPRDIASPDFVALRNEVTDLIKWW